MNLKQIGCEVVDKMVDFYEHSNEPLGFIKGR
jgi:hypothetical protein